MNSLYLRVGGYEEINRMCYWEFISVLQVAQEANKPRNGKLHVRQGLYKSQKDMIARTKELMRK